MFFIPFIGFSIRSGPTENYGKVVYDYATRLLDEVMKENNALVAEEDRERFTSIYVHTFLRSAKSIYTAKRHSKTLAEALPILKDKVNICDLITITGTKIFYPKLYEVINKDGSVLTGPASQAINDEHKRQMQELRVKLDAIVDWYDEQSGNGNYIRGMLISLFPRLDVAYRNSPQTNEHYLDCLEKKRICSNKHFDLYFSIQYVTL